MNIYNFINMFEKYLEDNFCVTSYTLGVFLHINYSYIKLCLCIKYIWILHSLIVF